MADDITNQQLLDALTQQLATISDNMVVRKDVEEIVDAAIGEAVKPLATKEELKAATKDLATKEELNSATLRLERKLTSHQKANVNHHLETRSQVGKLNKELSQMREGLARAASLT